jgi:hypothetical protein
LRFLPLALQTYEQFLTEHVRFCEERVKNSKLPSLAQNLRLARAYLSSFTGHGRYSVLKDSNTLPSSATNSPIAATSKTSDVAPIAPTSGDAVAPISTSSGRVIRRPVHILQITACFNVSNRLARIGSV